MGLTTDELLKLIVPIVMIAISLMVRKNPKMEGKIVKWWGLLVLGLILLIFRLIQFYYRLSD